MSIVFIPGNFNSLHIGHIRLFEYCFNKKYQIIIGLFDDNEPAVEVKYSIRLKNLNQINGIKKIIKITSFNYYKILCDVSPSFLLKGSDRELTNIEKKYITENNCKQILSSANLTSIHQVSSSYTKYAVNSYISKYKINFKNILNKLNNFRPRVAVFGDLIIDEYVNCKFSGVSMEDGQSVYVPIENNISYGGAFFSIRLLNEICKSIFYFNFIEKNLKNKILSKYSLNNVVSLSDNETNFVTKKRYVDEQDKILFRFSNLDDHSMPSSKESAIIKSFAENILNFDMVIFSDFSYGAISKKIIKKVKSLCEVNKIPIYADSQTSSQLGNLNKFHDICLITPTEHEARMCLQSNDGLALLANKLIKTVNTKYLIITLGKYGIYIVDNSNDNLEIGTLPALNLKAKYISGAGDTVLSYTSYGLTSGLNIWESAFLGSVAASIKVGQNHRNSKILKKIVKYFNK